MSFILEKYEVYNVNPYVIMTEDQTILHIYSSQ